MPPQSREETKKLLVFVGVVLGLLGLILFANVTVHDRSALLSGKGDGDRSQGAGAPLRLGLERLARNPTKCAMTMDASPDNERPMRHVNAGLIGKPDVLVLGQSDADHMSKTFFKDSVGFYNGFLSNSYFVYHYEAFEDVVAAHGVPKLVLYDVRSGYLLRGGLEPGWDSPPPGDPVWWGFPPFHLGKAKPVPWYRDLPSLLSLAQTEQTLTWLRHQLPERAVQAETSDMDTDTGAQFRCVPVTQKSKMYRWLGDGSRIYAGELDAVLEPHGAIHLDEAVGDRHLNETRFAGLEFVLGRIKAEGSTIIVYSPPTNPVVFDDPRQIAAVRGAGARVKAITDSLGIDYCDLTLEAASLGCAAGDFADEHHISRHCDARIVRRLATGCAPRAGAMLKEMLNAETLN
jgi:hypothetical protein